MFIVTESGHMSQNIDLIITPKVHDLGGFSVRRALPAPKMRMVGPFIFFDHFGPASFPPGKGIDVRAHPHIGLATVTYLFDGEIVHRDSLGFEQAIRPGDVNWMTAGQGIVHSERTASDERARQSNLHGVQTWLALPKPSEASLPSFVHHSAQSLPEFTQGDATIRLIVGTAFGHEAPAKVASPMVYLDVQLPAAGVLMLPPEHQERAIYATSGDLNCDGTAVPRCTMAVLASGANITIKANEDSRFMICGGAPMDGPRHMWWNFVASDQAIIEQAKQDWIDAAKKNWQGTRFVLPPDESEYIPLPD